MYILPPTPRGQRDVECATARIACVGTKLTLDPHEAVVFGGAIGPRKGAGLDLSALGGNSEIGDRCIFGFAGAMRHHHGVAGLVRAGDRLCPKPITRLNVAHSYSKNAAKRRWTIAVRSLMRRRWKPVRAFQLIWCGRLHSTDWRTKPSRHKASWSAWSAWKSNCQFRKQKACEKWRAKSASSSSLQTD